MFDFIIQWKDLIIYAFLVLLAIVQVILVIVKKPVKVVDDIREIILEIVPKAINYVEYQSFVNSSNDKLSLAVDLVFDYLLDVKGYKLVDIKPYEFFIKNNIENVLSTPQKKEGGN